MPRIAVRIPDDVYRNINEEVSLGIFSSVSDAVNSALKKAYARKSRQYLKWLIKKEDINESEMLAELRRLRK